MTLRTRNPDVCKSHERHKTHELAVKEMCRLFAEQGIRVVVFPSSETKPCTCGGWHVGHLRQSIKQSERKRKR